MPQLTVIMPAYNAGSTLRTAIRSTLRAMPRDSGLLVYDDGSTDDTLAVLDRIDDPRVTTIEGGTNRGVVHALNTMLASVDSLLLGRMDADDISFPWRFRSQMRALRAGADVAFGTHIPFDGTAPTVRPCAPVPISTDAFPLHLTLGPPGAHSTMLANTSVIVESGGYADVPAEDFELWLRLAVAGHRICRVGTPAIAYRVHEGQTTRSEDWKARPPMEPGLTEAYRALCKKFLGVTPNWVPNFRRNRQPASSAQALVAAVTAASGHLGFAERAYLRRRARQTLDQAVDS